MTFARWALLASALGVTGSFGATLLAYPANPRVMRIGRNAAWALVLSSLFVIAAQLYAWFGVEGYSDPANLWTMLSITLWGLHWTWLATAAVAAAVVLTVATRNPRAWIFASGFSALGVAAMVPLIGHGGTHDAVILFWHRVHVFGAGTWIGSLAVVALAGRADPPALLASLRRFAPIAFTGAALIAISGAALAWIHMRPLSTFWTTDYGRVLTAKIAATLIVGALGFVNWRGPRLRVVIAEVTIAVFVVLALTAWLSGLEMPGGH